MALGVGSLVWEKWRNDWYMGQVVERDERGATRGEEEEGSAAPEDTPAAQGRVKIHIHGEPETRDKWYDLPTANVVELVVVQAKETAVGVFPRAGDAVELLVLDESLARAAGHDAAPGGRSLLAGTVVKVFPGRDASMVEVDYPIDYPLVPGGTRRVCVGNGFLRVRRGEGPQ